MAQFDEVIKAAGFTEYHKEILQPYYNDGLEFIMDAGVPEEIAKSDKAIGCLARYVLDAFSLNSTAVDLSPFFFRRLKQLQIKEVESNAEEPES